MTHQLCNLAMENTHVQLVQLSSDSKTLCDSTFWHVFGYSLCQMGDESPSPRQTLGYSEWNKTIQIMTDGFLVGGLYPSEKYERQLG